VLKKSESAAGTQFFVDSENDCFAVFMAQTQRYHSPAYNNSSGWRPKLPVVENEVAVFTALAAGQNLCNKTSLRTLLEV